MFGIVINYDALDFLEHVILCIILVTEQGI